MKASPIVTELIPVGSSRDSFYGKAKVIHTEDMVYLMSYDTIVASIKDQQEIRRYTDKKSTTTSRHLKSFLSQFSQTNLSNSDFYKLPISKYEPIMIPF